MAFKSPSDLTFPVLFAARRLWRVARLLGGMGRRLWIAPSHHPLAFAFLLFMRARSGLRLFDWANPSEF